MKEDLFKKNVRGWQPTEKDYRLVFREIDGVWREISGNLPQYNNMCLADYLDEMSVYIPCDCTFCRIEQDHMHMEYRDFGGYIRIDVRLK